MVNDKVRRRLRALLVTTFVVGSSALTLASEPGNNNFTASSTALTGDWEVLVGTNSGFVFGITGGSIGSNSDVDHILVNCSTSAKPHIDSIRLGGDSLSATQALPGDYDVRIYSPDNAALLGSGTAGSTMPENVDISGLNRSTVVAKVSRFSGALGNYYLRVNCGT